MKPTVLTVTANFHNNAAQNILRPFVPETVSIREMNLWNNAEPMGREPITSSVAG